MPAALRGLTVVAALMQVACGGAGGSASDAAGISVALSPTFAVLKVGETQSFTATVSETADTAVTWTVDGQPVGTAALSGTGNTITYTAPGTAGNHTLTATSKADSSRSASAEIRVQDGCAPAPGDPRVVSVATYGATGDDSTDDTAAIQRAVDAVAGTGGTVLVPRGTYRVNARATSPGYGIRLGNRMTLRLEPGAVLQAIPNASPGYIILLASGVSEVNIVGGGALEGDLGAHGGTTGEGGYCLQISNGSHGIVVEDITAREAWGDGFYVDRASDVTFCRVTADHNRRQGMSIVEADRITVRNSTFSRTLGFMVSGEFLCGTGLDIEPNPGQTVSNVTITGCAFTDNLGSGIASGLAEVNADAAWTHDIVIDGNTMARNGTAAYPAAGIHISGKTRDQWVTNNVVDGNTSLGIILRSGATGIRVVGNTVSNTRAVPSAPYVVDRPGCGILFADVGGNTITGNTGTGNAGCGLWELRPTTPNTVSDNHVGGNGTCP